MKALKAICAAAAIALSLSIPAHAESTDPGIVHLPGITTPAGGSGSKSLPGDSRSPGVTSTELGDISSSVFMETLWTLLSIL